MKVLVNNGRRRLGIPGRPAIILAPGESVPVNSQQIAEIARNRTVSHWLASGTLNIRDADGNDVKPERPPRRPPVAAPGRGVGRKDDVREVQELPEGVTGEGIETHTVGGGWFAVYVNGFKVTDTNVRKDEAEKIAAEYE